MGLALVVPRNCTAGDYKEWFVALPRPQDSVDKRSRHCVQGRREVFQGIASKADCYNGNQYSKVEPTVIDRSVEA